MNTRAAVDLFWSGVFSFGRQNWCEPAQAALVPPMFGSGATPHSRPFFSLSVLMFQMPFQLKAVFPFCRAIASASCATFFGLCPFFTRSVNQLSPFTAGSSAQTVLEASSLKRSPPNCQISAWTLSTPVKGKGVAQWPWIPLLFNLSSAAPYSSAVIGGLAGSSPAWLITVLL